jgi:SAM-dependent methyltransferase
MFASPAWQAVQLAWEDAEDADDQVDRVERALRLEPGMHVLDVPCGTGRIARRLAARGYTVVGVDLTERFLEEGRARGGGVRYVHGDMRDLPLRPVFDAAVCLWGSFAYFDDEGNLAQAASVARALRPGGRFLVDALSHDAIEIGFRERDAYVVGDTAVEERRVWNGAEGRIDTTWTFERAGERTVLGSSMRLYTLDELTDLLARAGFRSFEARDDALDPFEPAATRLWLLATV